MEQEARRDSVSNNSHDEKENGEIVGCTKNEDDCAAVVQNGNSATPAVTGTVYIPVLVDIQMVETTNGYFIKELAYKSPPYRNPPGGLQYWPPPDSSLHYVCYRHNPANVRSHRKTELNGRVLDRYTGLEISCGEEEYSDQHVVYTLRGYNLIYLKGHNKKRVLGELFKRCANLCVTTPKIVNVDSVTMGDDDRSFCENFSIGSAKFSFTFVYRRLQTYLKLMSNHEKPPFPDVPIFLTNVIANDERFDVYAGKRPLWICPHDHTCGQLWFSSQRCAALNLGLLETLWYMMRDKEYRDLLKREPRVEVWPCCKFGNCSFCKKPAVLTGGHQHSRRITQISSKTSVVGQQGVRREIGLILKQTKEFPVGMAPRKKKTAAACFGLVFFVVALADYCIRMYIDKERLHDVKEAVIKEQRDSIERFREILSCMESRVQSNVSTTETQAENITHTNTETFYTVNEITKNTDESRKGQNGSEARDKAVVLEKAVTKAQPRSVTTEKSHNGGYGNSTVVIGSTNSESRPQNVTSGPGNGGLLESAISTSLRVPGKDPVDTVDVDEISAPQYPGILVVGLTDQFSSTESDDLDAKPATVPTDHERVEELSVSDSSWDKLSSSAIEQDPALPKTDFVQSPIPDTFEKIKKALSTKPTESMPLIPRPSNQAPTSTESSEAVSGVTEDGGEPVPAPADFPSPTVTAVVPSTGAVDASDPTTVESSEAVSGVTEDGGEPVPAPADLSSPTAEAPSTVAGGGAVDHTTVESSADADESSEAVSGVTEDGGDPVPVPTDLSSPTAEAPSTVAGGGAVDASDPTSVESGADTNKSSEAVSGETEDGGEPVPAPADSSNSTTVELSPPRINITKRAIEDNRKQWTDETLVATVIVPLTVAFSSCLLECKSVVDIPPTSYTHKITSTIRRKVEACVSK
ncbi:hypothetical protein J6590_087494 [Homalodisca vitripennis]|nr:hypothetical protein J6590_087494 [Homalodisca vitripennis]